MENPLRATNKELRARAQARLQELVNAGYHPAPDVTLPELPAIIQQAAAALLAQLLDRTTAPQALIHQLGTVIVHLTRMSDAGGSAEDGRAPLPF